MKKVTFLMFALTMLIADVHMEFELLTPDGDLFPGCEVEPERRPVDRNGFLMVGALFEGIGNAGFTFNCDHPGHAGGWPE